MFKGRNLSVWVNSLGKKGFSVKPEHILLYDNRTTVKLQDLELQNKNNGEV